MIPGDANSQVVGDCFSGPARSRLESLIDRFEEAWAQGQRPAIDNYLPPEGPARRAVLRELIHIELENRLKAGEAARVEEYLERFSDVAQDPAVAVALILREYELRRRRQPNLSLDEYARRFPRYGAALVSGWRVKMSGPAEAIPVGWAESSQPTLALREKISGIGEALPIEKTQPISASDTPPNSLHGLRGPDSKVSETGSPTVAMVGLEDSTHPTTSTKISRLGPYRVIRVLGAGGMGIVYQGEDVHLKRQVALKVMRPEVARKPTARERFLREAQAAAALEHENIAGIYQVGEESGVLFLAMPLLNGMSLEERLRQAGSLPVAEVLRVGRQAALGLAAAHARGLIHRDIKPANLWLESEDRVKILDFGLAHVADESISLTEFGLILGTPAYLAPEQARGEEPDPRSDLFSLGVVLYRMCTGQLPFRGNTPMAVLSALLQAKPQPVRELNRDVPPALAELIERLLSEKPADRPGSAQEVADRLGEIERGSPTASGRRLGAKRRGVIAAAAILLALPVVGYFVSHRTKDQGAQGQVVNEEEDLDIDRRAAEWVMSVGGTVTVQLEGGEVDVRRHHKPPPGPIKLAKVDLNGSSATDSDLWRLEGLRNLTSLQLWDAKVGDAGLAHIRNVKSLRWLHVGRGQNVTDAGMVYLKDLTNLEDLGVYGLELSDSGLMQLTGLVNLRRLQYGGDLTDDGVAHLPRFTKLEYLNISGNDIGDPGLAHLRGMTGLRELHLGSTHITNAGLAQLEGLTNLTVLSLYETLVSDAGLAHLKKMTRLSGLNLRDTRVGDSGLERLKGFTKLAELWLNYTKVTDAGMEHLKGLTSLTALDLRETDVGDLGIEQLQGLKKLSKLWLSKTAVTDAGMPHLAALYKLSQLYLNDTQVTDAGLEQLKGLVRLGKLDLNGTKVTAAGVAELRQALPRCEIIYSGSQ